jgi:glutamate racemase
MKIAFFDSGIGGMTVLREAIELIHNEKYVYYADSLNAPYGTRDKDEVRKLTISAIDSLEPEQIKALVVACNTATSTAIEELRARYPFPVIGMEPALKPAVEKNLDGRILVLATPLTLREEKFRQLVKKLDSEDKVDILPLQELVSFAENFIFSGQEVDSYLQKSFEGISFDEYSSIVLGCTHFSFYREQIERISGNRAEVIDGNNGTVRRLQKILDSLDDKGDGFGFEVYISGEKVVREELMDIYMQIISGHIPHTARKI